MATCNRTSRCRLSWALSSASFRVLVLVFLGRQRLVAGAGDAEGGDQRDRGHADQEDRHRREQARHGRIVPAPAQEPLRGGYPSGVDRLVVDESPQVGSQFGGGGIAVRRVAVDGLVDDGHEIARHLSVQPVQPRRFGRRHLFDQPVALLLVERRAARPTTRTASAPASKRRHGHRPCHRTPRAACTAECRGCRRSVSGFAGRPTLAMPKSVTQTVPVVSRSKFDGLMSRWRMP